MKDNIVLILMQLKGISRKTIFKNFSFAKNRDYSNSDIPELLEKANLNGGHISNYSNIDINNAIIKAKDIEEKSEKNNIKIISFLDTDYPQRLLNTQDPPSILYFKGNIKCINEGLTIAVIGTREPTEFGIKIAGNLGESLGKRGDVVVSGLAIGCDQYGHEGCVKVHGKSVAVLPCGLDKVYPAKNKNLAQKILDNNGCLISEYPIETKVFKNFFIERDRLQSGLSDGVIVVETDIKGGTMHTVGYTLDYKRVLACYKHPDRYLNEPKTFGNQKLIKEKKAISLSNNLELEEFRVKLENLRGNNIQRQENVTIAQRDIFEYLKEGMQYGDNL